MGLYRNEFATVREFAFTEGLVNTWEQNIPHIGGFVLLGMNKSSDEVRSVSGEASIELLGMDPMDLETPIRVGYKSKDDVFQGFYYTHRGAVQKTEVPEGFDEIIISDEDGGLVKLFNSGESISQRVSRVAGDSIIPAIGMQFCAKLVQLDNDSNPVLSALKAEMSRVA